MGVLFIISGQCVHMTLSSDLGSEGRSRDFGDSQADPHLSSVHTKCLWTSDLNSLILSLLFLEVG